MGRIFWQVPSQPYEANFSPIGINLTDVWSQVNHLHFRSLRNMIIIFWQLPVLWGQLFLLLILIKSIFDEVNHIPIIKKYDNHESDQL